MIIKDVNHLENFSSCAFRLLQKLFSYLIIIVKCSRLFALLTGLNMIWNINKSETLMNEIKCDVYGVTSTDVNDDEYAESSGKSERA